LKHPTDWASGVLGTHAKQPKLERNIDPGDEESVSGNVFARGNVYVY